MSYETNQIDTVRFTHPPEQGLNITYKALNKNDKLTTIRNISLRQSEGM